MSRRERERTRELEEVVRLLAVENEDLTNRAEDTLVLGLVAEKLNVAGAPEGVIARLLETVCLVKDIAWAACYAGTGGEAGLMEAFTSLPGGREPGAGEPLDPGLAVAGFATPRLLDAVSALLLQTGFQPAAGYLVPVVPAAGTGCVLAFAAEGPDGAERLAAAGDLLARVGYLLGLRLAQAARINRLETDRAVLDRAVRERTADLAASEARLQAIYDAAFDAFLVLDPRGHIRDANRKAGRALGREPRDLVGTTFGDVLAEPFPGLQDLLNRAATGQVATAALRFGGREGEAVDFEARIGPLTLAQENLVLVLARDVSERNTLRAQLDHAQKMELVGRLSGGVAHDFNNVLMAMLGQAELMLDEESDPRRREDLQGILEAGGRGQALTRQLLAFSRRQNVVERTFDLAEVLQGGLRLVGRLVGDGFSLVAEQPQGPLWVHGDPTRLEQVLLNLVVNARDAMPDGGEIRVRLGEAPDGSGDAYLTVADTGGGIPDDARERIFEPFYTTKGEGRGTGLGLSVVQNAVEQHGGRVGVVESSPAGSVFAVQVPCCEAPVTDTVVEAGGLVRGDGELILVVENEPGVRSVLARGVERLGYRVLAAADGREAGAQVADDLALVVSDVGMRGLGGTGLVKRLRENRADLPAIFVSGYLEDAVRAELAGMPRTAVLDKPVSLSVLSRAIGDLLAPSAG